MKLEIVGLGSPPDWRSRIPSSTQIQEPKWLIKYRPLSVFIKYKKSTNAIKTVELFTACQNVEYGMIL